MSETPARPQSAEQLLDAYYGKAGASRVILPSQEIYRFAAYVASELSRLRAECDKWKKISGCDTPDGLRALMGAAAEGGKTWEELLKKAEAERDGLRDILRNLMQAVTSTVARSGRRKSLWSAQWEEAERALAALPDPPKGEVK